MSRRCYPERACTAVGTIAAMAMPTAPRGYELINVLGRGGSGSCVYLARQVSLNRLVALKNLPAGGLSGTNLQMFRDEARAVGSLRHPNIVSAFDFAQDSNGLWLATQLVRGPDLRALTRKVGRLGPGFAVSVVFQTGNALAAAHAAGIVHRDVKPANVLVGVDGAARLTDFGVAQMAGSTATAGLITGTPTYMAPEQVRGSQWIDGRTDLYALAIIAYELIVGRYPFDVDRKDADAVMAAQVHTVPTDPAAFGVRLPRRVAKSLMGALSKDPQRRPATVAQWCSDLGRGLRRAPREWSELTVPVGVIAEMDPTLRRS